MLIVVVLPAPFGPRKPNTSPAATSKLTPRTASTSPKDFCSSRTSIAGISATGNFIANVQLRIGATMADDRGTARAQEASRRARRSRARRWGCSSSTASTPSPSPRSPRAADVSEKTVFNYFPAKEDLVLHRRPGALRRADRGDPRAPARRLARRAVPRCDDGASSTWWRAATVERHRRRAAARDGQQGAARPAVPRLGAGGRGMLAPVIAEAAGAAEGGLVPAVVARTLAWTHRLVFRAAFTRLLDGEDPTRVARRPARAGAPGLRSARARPGRLRGQELSCACAQARTPWTSSVAASRSSVASPMSWS